MKPFFATLQITLALSICGFCVWAIYESFLPPDEVQRWKQQERNQSAKHLGEEAFHTGMPCPFDQGSSEWKMFWKGKYQESQRVKP